MMIYRRDAAATVEVVNATGAAPLAATREAYARRHPDARASAASRCRAWSTAGSRRTTRHGTLPLEQCLRRRRSRWPRSGFPVSARAGGLSAQATRSSGDFPAIARDLRAATGGRCAPARSCASATWRGRCARSRAEGGGAPSTRGRSRGRSRRLREAAGGLLTADDLAAPPGALAGADQRRLPRLHRLRGAAQLQRPRPAAGAEPGRAASTWPALGCEPAEAIHLMVEAKRLAFADREEYMADPDWVDVPIEGLLSKEYAAERAPLIDPERAAAAVAAGRPVAVRPARPRPTTGRPARPAPRATRPASRSWTAGQRGLPDPEHPARLRLGAGRRRDRHPAEQPDDLLAPRRGPRRPAGAGQAGAPHDEPGDGVRATAAAPGLRHARRRHAGADQPAAADRRRWTSA